MNIKTILAEHQILETERLILRKFKMSDAPDLFEIWSNPDVTEGTGTNSDVQLDQSKDRIANYFIPEALIVWALENKLNGKMIGFVELHINGDQGELGWMLNQKFWGKGFAPEAASAIQELAFHNLNLNIVTASCNIENTKSSRVMEKLGLKKMANTWAFFHNSYHLSAYYAQTKEDYEANYE